MNRFIHLPFKTFMLNTFKKLTREDFEKLKNIVHLSKILHGQQFPYELEENDHDILHKCIIFLQSGEYVKPEDVTVLYTLFACIERKDLLDDVHQYENNILQKDPADGSPVSLTKQQFMIRILVLASILTSVLLFDSFVGFSTGLQFIGQSLFLKLVIVAVAAASYVYYDDLRDKYRYFKFTRGCISGSLLFFEYATKDYQKAMIEDCNEFPFAQLQQKYPYLTRSPNINIHYFLNTNRCINGGERHVASLLDGKKAVLGDEVYGLEADTNIVYTYSTKYHTWLPFLDAKYVVWKKSANYATAVL